MSTSTHPRGAAGTSLESLADDVGSVTAVLVREYDAGVDINEMLFEAVSAAQRTLDERGRGEALDDHSAGWWEALPLSELMARHRVRVTVGDDVL
ncbi:MAG TPA: hypothetical protein VFL99_09545 [Segeticoccus sp.]|uniref:hypothetical protein n=1 Tax=Segeticoccus sp. TaxID=2706531 RepID=UPI002D80033A|nr:hypothetical protein [Segeticoccus sp.]HET8600558.1 hypothetical protein [Segeticoccus sp.]